MAETQVKSRYQKVTKPPALPGCCFFCNGVEGRDFFIDTGRDVEFHGAVYICNLCIEEMARMLDYITPELAAKLKEHVGRLERDIFVLTKKESGLEVAIGGLVAAGFTGNSDDAVLGGDGVTGPVPTPEPQEREDNVGAGEGETPESSDDEGVDELHPDASSDARSEFTLDL